MKLTYTKEQLKDNLGRPLTQTDRVRITPSGSNTFDAGEINIAYSS